MKRSSGTLGQVILIAVGTGFAMLLLSSYQPIGEVDVTKIVLIGVGILVCFVAYLLWSGIRPQNLIHRRPRRRRSPQNPRPAVDAMTRHLEHGDMPQLGDDGEIHFHKRSKHSAQSREE